MSLELLALFSHAFVVHIDPRLSHVASNSVSISKESIPNYLKISGLFNITVKYATNIGVTAVKPL
jgi:hypothetical protein